MSSNWKLQTYKVKLQKLEDLRGQVGNIQSETARTGRPQFFQFLQFYFVCFHPVLVELQAQVGQGVLR